MKANIQQTTSNIQTEDLDTAALALMAMTKLEALQPEEARKLQVAEAQINAGLEAICNSYVEIGRALDQIRERRLYRATHGTFEEYCSERWGRTARWARQRIEGARVAVNLLQATTETSNLEPRTSNLEQAKPNLPATERVARPLVPLGKEEQREVWQEAVKQSSTGNPTAVEVKAAVERRSVGASERRSAEEGDWPNLIPTKTAGLTLGDKKRGEVMATLRWVIRQLMDLKETAERLGRFSGQAEYHRQIVVDHVKCLSEQFERAGRIEDNPASQKATKETWPKPNQHGVYEKGATGLRFAWPKPNQHGVYEKGATGLRFTHKDGTARILVLQVDANVWISAFEVDHRCGSMHGYLEPLRRDKSHPGWHTREAAIIAAAEGLRKGQIEIANGGGVGTETPQQRRLAKCCAEWASNHIGNAKAVARLDQVCKPQVSQKGKGKAVSRSSPPQSKARRARR